MIHVKNNRIRIGFKRIEQSKNWILAHKIFFTICFAAFLCDSYHNGMISLDFIGRTIQYFNKNTFLIYLKNCLISMYELKPSLLALSISIASIFFAVISFMYNNLKDDSFGIPLSDMYFWKYEETLNRKRKVLLICTPLLLIFSLLNYIVLAIASFGYLLFKFFTVFSRMILIFESQEKQDTIIKIILKEIKDYNGRYSENDNEFFFCKKVFYKTNKNPDSKVFLYKIVTHVFDSIKEEDSSEGEKVEMGLPIGYYLIFYEMAMGILVTGINTEKENTEANETAILKILEKAGSYLSNMEADKCILKCLSAEMGIITAVINYYRDAGSNLMDVFFDGQNCERYWPGYTAIIYKTMGVLFELMYEKGISVEPLLGYLKKKNIASCILSETNEKRGAGDQNCLLLCTNFTAFEDFSYVDILKVFSCIEEEVRLDKMPSECKTYIGRMGLWRYKR